MDEWVDAIQQSAAGKLERVGEGVLATDGTFSFDAAPAAAAAAVAAAAAAPAQAEVTMAGYLSASKRSGKKRKGSDKKWYVLDQAGTLKVFKDAEGFSRTKPVEETKVLGAMVTRDPDAGEDCHSIRVQIPAAKEPLMLEADDAGSLEAWIAGFVDVGAVLLDAPVMAEAGPVDLLSDDIPAGAVEHCCFEDFIFARGTPREKTVSPLLTGVLKVARAADSAKKGAESASSWGDFVECNFRLDGQLLEVLLADLESETETAAALALENEAALPVAGGGESTDSPGTQRAKLKQKVSSAKLKANDLKVRAAKKILSGSNFEHGDGQLNLHASKHHDVVVLEDECAFALVGGGSGST